MTSSEPVQSSADRPTIPPVTAQPPLQRPTLRVQDGDIIVEDAAPNLDGDAQVPTAYVSTTQRQPPPEPSPVTPAPTPGVGLSTLSPVHQSSQITLNSLNPQLSRDNTHPNGGGHSPPDGATSRPNGVGSFRLHFETQAIPGVGAKLRTTELTAANVQQLAKQSGEPWRFSTNERLWQWLEDAGPPYDVQPSVGVGSRTAQQPSIASSQSGAGGPGRWFSSCFRCIAR